MVNFKKSKMDACVTTYLGVYFLSTSTRREKIKVALWRRCLAACRAKPVVPVLRDRCSCIYVVYNHVGWAVCLNWNKKIIII